ncbi:hypothetical protein GX50_05887 [[Emmonsia] crescens]|uniref:Uncharacterized protein n=1 Tax=[Emmonsia] crescens TaxID=73230 RepID=A0A2B7ZDW7_9EURO|nr:hypothetical protein GX50_05887 [Emmonsia crescens]
MDLGGQVPGTLRMGHVERQIMVLGPAYNPATVVKMLTFPTITHIEISLFFIVASSVSFSLRLLNNTKSPNLLNSRFALCDLVLVYTLPPQKYHRDQGVAEHILERETTML